MNWRFAVYICTFSIVLSGCVSVQPQTISPQNASSIRGKSIVVDSYVAPSFTAMTPGKAMLGIIGAGLMASEGNRFIRDSQIADPSISIGDGLAQGLTREYDLIVKTSDAKPLDTDSIDVIVARYPDSDLVLDSRTLSWAYTYFPDHWNTYRLLYSAKIRLIDTHTKTVIAEGLCKNVPAYSADLPTYDKLTANSGEWVKAKLSAYAESCIDEFGTTSLNLPHVVQQAGGTAAAITATH
ncbi:hypothetical protein [Caballeronia sp. KNU42]